MPSYKQILAKIFAAHIKRKIYRWASHPGETQNKVFRQLIAKGTKTKFGKEHHFEAIKSHQDFCKRVPIRDYEDLKGYINLVVDGEMDIIWPGKPLYFAKTSGTTSGTKYIPITKESMPHHIEAARNAILLYISSTGNTNFVDGKMIFLQGSPELTEKNGVKIGRLSGIVAHYVPTYLQKNRLPSWDTNCIEDWEKKVDAIVAETLKENMTVISGIPPWVQMYFEKIIEKTGKSISEVFPNFNLFIYGGVNFDPYRKKFEELIGKKVDSIELFPASEGFFAFQDSQSEKGMLLLLNSGIFYEFVKADTFFDENPERLTITQVELDINYVMIVSTNAGLWAYNVGDTIKFTSLRPYRVVVTGRIKHFISAFGEHVISKEVEHAMKHGLDETKSSITEFTVAPQINPPSGLPYHEWFIEFENEPEDISELAHILDQSLQEQNSYYFDLISGHILRPLKITPIQKNGFNTYMKSIGKQDAQNKLPRLANDRSIADQLESLNLTK